ncbi:MAG TPA: hypothetical protein VGI71_22055 [Scandinavium sp.]
MHTTSAFHVAAPIAVFGAITAPALAAAEQMTVIDADTPEGQTASSAADLLRAG